MEKEEVGRRIRFFREKKQWTQNYLATTAGVSPTYIYQIEKGQKSVTIDYLSYICSALGVSLEEFFRDMSASAADNIAALSDEQRQLLNAFLESIK